MKGFTLVEIIVAAVILALVITGMFGVFSSGERYSVEDKQKLQAVNMNRTAIEYLRKISFDELNTCSDCDASDLKDEDGNNLIKEDPLEDYRQSFTYTVGSGDYKTVESEYLWKLGKTEKKITLLTIITNSDVTPTNLKIWEKPVIPW